MGLDLFNSMRTRFDRDHALITPDNFLTSTLPGWDKTEAVVLISPQMRARFSQYFALMGPGAVGAPAPGGVERVVFVLDGEVTLKSQHDGERTLGVGGYAYLPPGADTQVHARAAARINLFEKPYNPLPGIPPPRARVGQEQNVETTPLLGDPDVQVKTLLPTELAFDLAVNIMSYKPGGKLPQVEVHVMEHGLLMLEGEGVYRLSDSWYLVQQGDVIWMASYCPQWFVAMGKNLARYLLYKDVNRDPLVAESRA